jgi:hypothetical protein
MLDDISDIPHDPVEIFQFLTKQIKNPKPAYSVLQTVNIIGPARSLDCPVAWPYTPSESRS